MVAYQLKLKSVLADEALLRPGSALPAGGDTAEVIRYADLIELVLRTPRGGQGVPLAEQRIRNRIRRQLRQDDGELLLSREEWQLLRDLVETFPWGAASFVVEEFCDAVLNCPTVEVEPKRS